MKRKLALLAMLLLCGGAAFAQKDTAFVMPDHFLELEQLPDEGYYLPAPPKEDQLGFANDILRYQWGKTVRATDRGKQAADDAQYTLDYLFGYYAEAFGTLVSEEATPETWKLLVGGIVDGGLAVKRGKRKYKRLRPYVYFGDSTPVPADEEVLRNSGSYPSGHTARGWMCALIMVQLNPDRQNAILKAGYEYGESRVIVGYHYQSDVDAARIASSAAFARLQSSEKYQKQLKKALKELKKLSTLNVKL